MLSLAFQGTFGAYSDLACRQIFPHAKTYPYESFEEVLMSCEHGSVDYAVIPVENSTAGRVADVHHLLLHTPLVIIGEHFLPVQHQLLTLPGTPISSIKKVISHQQAIDQCRGKLKSLGLSWAYYSDTAMAAEKVSQDQDPSVAALASSLAGDIYGLSSIMGPMNDMLDNTTRFLIFARQATDLPLEGKFLTAVIFETSSVPAALYKALGGFATNGINLYKLESYLHGASFQQSSFYMEFAGQQNDPSVILALRELGFFAQYKILGSFAQSSYRQKA